MLFFEKIKSQEKIDLVRNLSLLIRSGSPVNLSLKLLSNQTHNPTLKKVLLIGKERVEKGTPIYQVFENNNNFDNVFVSFIRAGEESGTLNENLIFLSNWLERDNSLKKEMSSATLYPKIIIVFATILGAGLSVFVLPKLISVFEGLNVDLPVSTRILLWITGIMENYGLQLLGGLIFFVILFYFVIRITVVKKIVDKIMIKLPIFGDLNKEYQLTIISRLSAILLKSGLPIRQILFIVGESVTNSQYKNSLKKITERIEKGTKLSKSLEYYPNLYPESFISIVSIGESTGSFNESMNYLADFFEDKVINKTKRLPIIIEPLLLIFIGIFVAFIASAIVLPVYQITTGI